MMLHRKLLRELGESKGQSLAIAAVVASGVAVFVMSLSTLSFLRSTRDAYYDRYRFADVFAQLRRAPQAIIPQLEAIPGVGFVQTRIVADVTLDVPGLTEPATGRLISLPEHSAPKLNAIHLRRGRLPDIRRPDEVLAGEAFFLANQLQLGDTFEAVLNGRLQELRIVGVALSPEYVFQIRAGDLLPDDQRFGVFWMNQRHLEAAFDMKGAFNDVSVRLLRGSRAEQVIDDLDRLLKPYGSVGAYDRDDQISAAFLRDEIKQLQGIALVAPVIFLGVAAFLLNVVLSRRIGAQREVIATLKAFGFSNLAIGWHYMQAALIVTFAGANLGALGGIWLASGLAVMYSKFYRFPEFIYQPDLRVVVMGIGLSVIAGVVGCFHAVRGAVRLMPAEAMRPAAPARYRRSFVEWLGINWLVPMSGRMIFRQLQRRPLSALLSTCGISASVALLLMGNFSPDAINYLIEFQYETAQRQDVQVVFEHTVSPDAIHELRHMAGVQTIEPIRAVGIKIRNGHHWRRTSITGLGTRRDLFRLLDSDEQPIRLPPSGLVLSDSLAKMLEVVPGDRVTIEVLEGQRETYLLQVVALVREYTGMNVYADLPFLHRLLSEDQVLSGAFLAVDSQHLPELYGQLKQTPAIASVSVKSAAIENFRKTIQENLMMFQSFNIFFAAVIAVGVVYNTARVSLDDRCRELSTMRVIGFTRAEVAGILLGELAVLTLVAIPLGWLAGYAFCYAMVQGFETEQYRIPLVIQPASFTKAALITMVAAAVSGLLVRRKLDHLDLVEVLKSRE